MKLAWTWNVCHCCCFELTCCLDPDRVIWSKAPSTLGASTHSALVHSDNVFTKWTALFYVGLKCITGTISVCMCKCNNDYIDLLKSSTSCYVVEESAFCGFLFRPRFVAHYGDGPLFRDEMIAPHVVSCWLEFFKRATISYNSII